MRPILIISFVALTMPIMTFANGLSYFNDSTIRAKSDASFEEAMQENRTAPNLTKGDPVKEVLAYHRSDKAKNAAANIRNAALIGNPHALLLMCLSRSDTLGPPFLLPEGLAWCRIAANMLPDAASIQRESARARLAEIKQTFPAMQLETSLNIEQNLKVEMRVRNN